MYICVCICLCNHVYINTELMCISMHKSVLCGHVHICRHCRIHVCEQYVSMFLWIFILTKEFVSWALSVADIRPCFKKHVFHLYGLLSPGCFLPPVKKCWTSSSFPPPCQITCPYWEKPSPSQSCRTLTHSILLFGQPQAVHPCPRWLSISPKSFLPSAFVFPSRMQILVGRLIQAASMGHGTSGSNNTL